MKKLFMQIFIVTMATLVGYASMGVTMHKYCCEACKEHHGNNYFSYVSCEDVHKEFACSCSNHFHSASCKCEECLNGIHHHTISCKCEECANCAHSHCVASSGACDLEHYDIDVFSSEKNDFSTELEVLDLRYAVDDAILFSSLNGGITKYDQSHLAVKPTSRGILCQKSVLLI